MKRPLRNSRLTADELLAADLSSIHDSDVAWQVRPDDVLGSLDSHDRAPTHLMITHGDLAAYTDNRISSTPLEELPKLLREIAGKRIYAVESWQTALQNYKQELGQHTVYFHEELGLQITAAIEKARITTAVQEASSMSLSLYSLKESFLATERYVDYELRVRLFREAK